VLQFTAVRQDYIIAFLGESMGDVAGDAVMSSDHVRILVAPDSFKGSIDAPEFCSIAEKAFKEAIPGCEVVGLPMADGGEGTAEALVRGVGGNMLTVAVRGPMGDPVQASYGLLGDGATAVVEMAQASGLPLIPAAQRNPLHAGSYGTGELILAALEQGARHIILGLGGSATNDGGMGALQALGIRFYGRDGELVAPIAGSLSEIASVDVSAADSRLAGVRFTIASDVTNPLLGECGATAIYAPQKGASKSGLQQLEQGMSNFADITASVSGEDHRHDEGAGAAGGMGFGFLSYTGAKLCSGFEVVAETYQLEQCLARGPWHLLVTGEGQVDSQSVQGKLVGRIAGMAARHSIPVLVVAGSVSGKLDALYQAGVTSVTSIVPGPMALEEAMQDAPRFLRQRLTDMCRLWHVGTNT